MEINSNNNNNNNNTINKLDNKESESQNKSLKKYNTFNKIFSSELLQSILKDPSFQLRVLFTAVRHR